jgi:hypothetical protein
MYLPPANGRIFGQILHFTPLFMADLVEILPSMQFSSNIMVYQTHFKQVSTGFQVDPSCLTIDKVKPQLWPNSAPFYHPVSVACQQFGLVHPSHFDCTNNKFNPLLRVLK